MRVSAQCAAAALAVAVLAWDGSPVTAQAPAAGKGDATAVLAAAREALGGEKKLTSIKTVTATGRTRQVRGDNLVPIEFELFIELPDKYIRKDEIPAQETGVTAAGFNGDELVQDPPPQAPPATAVPPAGPPPGAPGAPAGAPPMPRPNPSAARVTSLKQDFTRLMLGMFATSFPAYPLTFSYAAEAEAPQGKADVLEGKGPNNFTVRLFISRDTHLPLMVSWTPPAPPQRGRGPMPMPPGAQPPAAQVPAAQPPGGQTPGTQAPGAVAARGPAAPAGGAPAGPPENRLYFADYRDVDGVQLPFRLRRAVGADTVEETTFDRFKLNSKIDPKKFEVRK